MYAKDNHDCINVLKKYKLHRSRWSKFWWMFTRQTTGTQRQIHTLWSLFLSPGWSLFWYCGGGGVRRWRSFFLMSHRYSTFETLRFMYRTDECKVFLRQPFPCNNHFRNEFLFGRISCSYYWALLKFLRCWYILSSIYRRFTSHACPWVGVFAFFVIILFIRNWTRNYIRSIWLLPTFWRYRLWWI